MKKRNETVEHIIALLIIFVLFTCLCMVGVLFNKVGTKFMQLVVSMFLAIPVVIVFIIGMAIIKRIFK